MTFVNPFEVFFFIFISSLLSLGGGNGQIPVIQGKWVEPGILSPGLFSFSLAISYLTPGPKAGFIAGIGYYLAGVPGAIAAILGLAIPTCLAAGGVSMALEHCKKIVNLVKPSSSFIISSLIAAAAWSMASSIHIGMIEFVCISTVAFLVVKFKIEPILIVLSCAFIGVILSLLI